MSAWVTEIQSLEYNAVLVYKEQGVQQEDDMDNLSDSDFILCLQTSFQRDMLMKFGNDTICIDSTHSTNMYDFYLITILVVDDYGEGIPVGLEDAIALRIFFLAVHKACGMISPKWFMSDDAEQYYNAWKGVFNTSQTNKILCVWHIQRAWRKALRQHISDKNDQIHIYHSLNVLLQERDESHFRKLLQEFITDLSENHCTYFMSEYCCRIQQWATCSRLNCTANTNTFVESFHSVLKVVYLQKKLNRRVDCLLFVLMKIARNKVFKRLRKLEMGKQTHRICEISKRHKAAKILSPTSIESVTEMKWKVLSQSKNTQYTVEKVAQDCDCKILCKDCNICPHIYSCTCLDAT